MDNRTIKAIDWPSFRQAARNYYSTDVHLLKLVHDKLPTNYVKARYQSWTSPTCHFCIHPETFDHLCVGQCNPRSIAFREQLKIKIDDYFETTNTPATFRVSFQAALDIWLGQRNISDQEWIGPQDLFQEQNTIGWKQMFRGFLSNKWKHHLLYTLNCEKITTWCELYEDLEQGEDGSNKEDYMVHFTNTSDTPKATTRIDPARFMSRIIRIIWRNWESCGRIT
jgi:hypothetical protein